jgi:hypothetical protein
MKSTTEAVVPAGNCLLVAEAWTRAAVVARLKGSRSVEDRKGVPTAAAANLRNSWRVMRQSLTTLRTKGSRFKVQGSKVQRFKRSGFAENREP